MGFFNVDTFPINTLVLQTMYRLTENIATRKKVKITDFIPM